MTDRARPLKRGSAGEPGLSLSGPSGIRLYPDAPVARRRTVARDALLIACLLVLAWLAIRVHDGVASLEQVGHTVAQAGSSVQRGFDSAASSVAGAPIIGGQLSQGLRSAGASTGGSATSAAQQSESDVATAATVLGLLTFLLPAALILQRYLPARWRQIRRMTAAMRVLHAATDQQRGALLAQRAAFSLPYHQLLRHTTDPLGDLQAGRYEPLIAAVLEDAGIDA